MSQEFENIFDMQELNPGIITIKLGENLLGGNDALTFSSKLMELNDKNIKHVIVDLHNVKMINSSGIGMLVNGHTTLKKYNSEFILTGLSDKIKNILQMTHLDQIFRTFENVDEALKNIK